MKKGIVLLTITLLLFGCSEEAWENTKEKNTTEAYRTYLTENPEGKFMNEAKTELDKLIKDSIRLAEEETQKRLDEENKVWEKVLSENSFAAYYNYCNEYSDGGIHLEEAIEKSKEKFRKELKGEFKTVNEFFQYTTKLEFGSYENPEFDEVYNFFSKEHCEIDGINIPGIHDYNSFQVSETRNVYYQLQFTGEFFEMFNKGEFDYAVNDYPENTAIEIYINFIEDEYIEYSLSVKFETQNGELKITGLSADIDEPGC